MNIKANIIKVCIFIVLGLVFEVTLGGVLYSLGYPSFFGYVVLFGLLLLYKINKLEKNS